MSSCVMCSLSVLFQVLDDKNVKRRFRASNYQSTTRVKPFICTMPMRLDEGWNQIQFNLSDFTRRAYGTNYIETHRVQVSQSCCWPMPTLIIQYWYVWMATSIINYESCQIHANCRIRRVYFSDRLYSEDELPAEFKLYLPVQNKSPAKVRAVISLVDAGVKCSLHQHCRSLRRKHLLPRPRLSTCIYTMTCILLYNYTRNENQHTIVQCYNS